MKVELIPIDKIRPAPFQPREKFDKEKIGELGNSIKRVDLLQPIVVRKKGETYQIIAGERRWRAWDAVGRREIPAIVRVADDIEARELSLIENWHREDLTSVERENMVYALWQSERYNTHEDLAGKLGVNRQVIESIIEAKKFRDKKRIDDAVSTYDIRITRGLEEETRVKLLKKAEEEEIKGRKLEEYVATIKEAPEPLKKALLKPKSKITPERAETIIKYFPEEEQQREVIREIEKAKELEDAGIDAYLEDRRAIARGEREPEIHIRDPQKAMVERYRIMYFYHVAEISADHLKKLSEGNRREAIGYMKKAYSHLERELSKLGELRILKE